MCDVFLLLLAIVITWLCIEVKRAPLHDDNEDH